MKKVKAWFVENKVELLFGWGLVGMFFSIMLGILLMVSTVVTNDLVERIQIMDKTNTKLIEEKAAIEYDRNRWAALYDDVIQTYEDCVPKEQYITEIQYLESVIWELRGIMERGEF